MRPPHSSCSSLIACALLCAGASGSAFAQRAPQAVPAQAPRATPQQASPADKVLTLAADLYFEPGSAKLTPQYQAQLDDLLRIADRGKGYLHILVRGYADGSEGRPRNEDLAAMRAEAVMVYLVARGADARKVHAAAGGPLPAAVKNEAAKAGGKSARVTPQDRAKRRKAEVDVIRPCVPFYDVGEEVRIGEKYEPCRAPVLQKL